MTLIQLNQMFKIVDIWNYDKEKEGLLPISGSENHDLVIKYPQDKIIHIENGSFYGKYFIFEKVFNRFESLLLKKKAFKISLGTAGGID